MKVNQYDSSQQNIYSILDIDKPNFKQLFMY